VIAFGACIASREKFLRYAMPGISLVAEPDSEIAEVTTDHSIFEAYNEVLEAFTGREGLEALILLHEDTEIADPDMFAKVRERLADPEVAIVGAIGSRGVKKIGWYGGEWKGYGRTAWSRGVYDFEGGIHEVEAVDGFLLILSPWAVESLRFDEERFTGFHAYDVDLCFQARAAGKRVLIDDLALIHHTRMAGWDQTAVQTADETWRRKWIETPGAQPPAPDGTFESIAKPGFEKPTTLLEAYQLELASLRGRVAKLEGTVAREKERRRRLGGRLAKAKGRAATLEKRLRARERSRWSRLGALLSLPARALWGSGLAQGILGRLDVAKRRRRGTRGVADLRQEPPR